MSDPNAGKYKRFFKSDFECAKKALAPYGGTLEWATADYEAFIYKSDGVRIIFYPHKTSASNHHIRIRDSGSKDVKRFKEITGALRIAAGNCCTFSMKLNYRSQHDAANKIDPHWLLPDYMKPKVKAPTDSRHPITEPHK